MGKRKNFEKAKEDGKDESEFKFSSTFARCSPLSALVLHFLMVKKNLSEQKRDSKLLKMLREMAATGDL